MPRSVSDILVLAVQVPRSVSDILVLTVQVLRSVSDILVLTVQMSDILVLRVQVSPLVKVWETRKKNSQNSQLIFLTCCRLGHN